MPQHSGSYKADRVMKWNVVGGTVSSTEIAQRMGLNHGALMNFLANSRAHMSDISESGETRRIPVENH